MHFVRFLTAMTCHTYEHNELCGYYDDLRMMFSQELRKEAYSLPTRDYTKDIGIEEDRITMKFHFELPFADAWLLRLYVTISTKVENDWSIEASFVPVGVNPIDIALKRNTITSDCGWQSLDWVSALIRENGQYLRSIAVGEVPKDYTEKVKSVQALFDEFIKKTNELGMNLYVDTSTTSSLPPVVYIVPEGFTAIVGSGAECRKGCLPCSDLSFLQNAKAIQRFDPDRYILVNRNYTGK